MKKTKNLFLALGALLAAPIIGHAQTVIYSDSFESPGDTVNGYATGWGFTGGSAGSAPYTQFDQDNVGTTGVQFQPTKYTPPNGTQAAYIQNYGDTTPNDFFNGNVGATFQANTTYTLTYYYAIPPTFGGFYDFGPESFSLTSGGTATQLVNGPSTGYTFENTGTAGTVIAASTQSLTAAERGATQGSPGFFTGPTVTLDTAQLNSLVGTSIGIDVNYTNQAQSDGTVRAATLGFDDFVITATSDTPVATPEPSTYALTLAGLVVLGVVMRRKSVTV